jgi:ATP-dependent helicase/nuclease subunit A
LELSKEVSILTPSHLKEENEKWRERDDESGEQRNNAILVGLLCHRVLEEWDFKTPKSAIDKKQTALLDRAAKLFELSSASPMYDVVMTEAKYTLEKFLVSKTYDRLASVKILGREIPFCYEVGKSGQDGPHLLRGVIDLLYEENGRYVVADYKTNQISDGKLSEIIESYRLQGTAYQEAIVKNLGTKPDFELIFLRDGRAERLS